MALVKVRAEDLGGDEAASLEAVTELLHRVAPHGSVGEECAERVSGRYRAALTNHCEGAPRWEQWRDFVAALDSFLRHCYGPPEDVAKLRLIVEENADLLYQPHEVAL